MQTKNLAAGVIPCGPLKLVDARKKYRSLVDLIENLGAPYRCEQFASLIDDLTALGYFTAPASHKYHLAYRGGLLIHHVTVASVLLQLKRLLYPSISDESCVITGLLHDVGKLGTRNRPYYKSRTPGFDDPYTKQEMGANAPVYMGVAMRSLAIVSSKINLSTWESQAILYHDGQYISDNQSVRLKESPLTLLLHHADMWSAFQIEQKYPIPDEPFTEVGSDCNRGELSK